MCIRDRYPHSVDTIPGVGIVKGRVSMAQHEREKMKLLQRVRKLRGQLDVYKRQLLPMRNIRHEFSPGG